MKFFIDTANVADIKKANDMGVICGVTTNPSLIAKEGRDFVEVIKEITSIVDGPISGEVKATTVVEKAGALAAGETALVYVVVEPGTYSDLSFTVNDKFVKNINAAEATFTAGLIKKVNFEVK